MVETDSDPAIFGVGILWGEFSPHHFAGSGQAITPENHSRGVVGQLNGEVDFISNLKELINPKVQASGSDVVEVAFLLKFFPRCGYAFGNQGEVNFHARFFTPFKRPGYVHYLNSSI
jgi:hypothetical protein